MWTPAGLMWRTVVGVALTSGMHPVGSRAVRSNGRSPSALGGYYLGKVCQGRYKPQIYIIGIIPKMGSDVSICKYMV